MRKKITFLLCLLSSMLFADNYYTSAEGKHDQELKTALHDIISANPIRYTFGSGAHHTWDGFYYTDRRADNSVWDMYSNETRYFGDMYASISGIDIEHTFPKSWWGGSVNDGYKDLHLLTPADYSANRSKSNNAMGVVEVAGFDNGSFKVGKNSQYGDFKIFEPADEYKGDFARIFFYVATCYEDYSWVLDNTKYGSFYALTTNYLVYQPWLIDVLLAWNSMDPVSEKEIARQEAVYQIQGNRNPFIDYPCLAEYIWGNRKGQIFSQNDVLSTSDLKYLAMKDQSGCSCDFTEPTLVRPLKNSVITFNEQSRNEKQVQRVYLRGSQITQPLQIVIDDSESFQVEQSTVDPYLANVGTYLDITFHPKTLGLHQARMRIYNSTEVYSYVQLEGLCSTVFHAFEATNITEDSFTAEWSDAEVDEYMLDVYLYPQTCSDSTVLDLNPLTIANIHAQYNDNFEITGSVITNQSMLKLGSLERHGDATISGLPLHENNYLIGAATQYGTDDHGALAIIVNQDTIAKYDLDTTLTEFGLLLPDNVETIKLAQVDTTQRIMVAYLKISTCHRKPTHQSLWGYPISVKGTSKKVDFKFNNDTVYYRVTPLGGKESEEIMVYYDQQNALSDVQTSTVRYLTLDNTLYLFGILPQSRIEMYDMSGKLVSTTYCTTDNCTMPIPNTGVYILQITNNQSIEHIKLIYQ